MVTETLPSIKIEVSKDELTDELAKGLRLKQVLHTITTAIDRAEELTSALATAHDNVLKLPHPLVVFPNGPGSIYRTSLHGSSESDGLRSYKDLLPQPREFDKLDYPVLMAGFSLNLVRHHGEGERLLPGFDIRGDSPIWRNPNNDPRDPDSPVWLTEAYTVAYPLHNDVAVLDGSLESLNTRYAWVGGSILKIFPS